eukprot:273174-Chlamydomonas_euryale.AAC.1
MEVWKGVEGVDTFKRRLGSPNGRRAASIGEKQQLLVSCLPVACRVQAKPGLQPAMAERGGPYPPAACAIWGP